MTSSATPRLARFLRPYRHWATLAPLLMILKVAMDLMQPKMIQRIVDQGIAQLAKKGFYHNLYLSQFKGHHHLVPELAAQ